MAATRPVQTSPGTQQFEAFFQRADLDRDGRISGSEAVAFFQGSKLPQNVLAKIWQYCDRRSTGFLGRVEFYNALKLVTVAQSGRELTEEIVRAALEGPATAKIPPPKINPVATNAPSMTTSSVARHQFANVMPSQMGSLPPTSIQNVGFRGTQPHVFPNAGANQQSFTPQSNQFIRPHQTPILPTSVQMQPATLTGGVGMGAPRLPGSNAPNLSTDWFSARGDVPSTGGTSTINNKAPSPNQGGFGSVQFGPTPTSTLNPVLPSASVLPKSLEPQMTPVMSADMNSKALVPSGNGFSSEPGFGNDMFSALQPKQDTVKAPNVSSGSSSITATQHSVTPPVNFSSSGSAVQMGAGSFQLTSSLVKQSSLDVTSGSIAPTSISRIGTSGTSSAQSQTPWPKMTPSNVQKYTKVFYEVDKDRDGKITGEEARNLFLSWRLPREVLKQVWDLADQDSDSMLSLSEFCIALYLMERYREGCSLPPVLPNSVRFDDALIQATSQTPTAYGNLAWQTGPVVGFTQGISGARPMMPTTSLRPPVPGQPHAMGGQMQFSQQNSHMPVPDKQQKNQLSAEEQNTLKIDDTSATEEKAKELEKEIMDSKEKLEFYRTKMQELVLYKSRCDNRLNEISEKASADKREVEILAKKYEEKYKQVGEIASKLTVEEATFRDVQERKLELCNAMVKMEQGGSADGLLQVRADRIQSHLEELGKAFNERCQKLNLNVKSAAVIELPFGWQPGIQEYAVDWDEDWDKFEDEGFVLSKELSVDAKNITTPPRSKISSNVNFEEDSSDGGYIDSSKDLVTSERAFDTESAFAHSEDSPRQSHSDSPSRESRSIQFDNHEGSPHDNDSQSESGARSISGWGSTFDASNEDMESIWGFDNKEFGHDKNVESSFFDSGGFGLDPIRTESPSASSVFGKETSPFFVDSVPATPSFSSTSSPRYSYGQASFDSFRHSDSFSTQGGNLARFDSIRSSTDFDQSGLFNQRETLARFDSIRSTTDSERRGFQSFDDADPFGTGPFRSAESETPKQGSSSWSAF